MELRSLLHDDMKFSLDLVLICTEAQLLLDFRQRCRQEQCSCRVCIGLLALRTCFRKERDAVWLDLIKGNLQALSRIDVRTSIE